MAEGIRKRGEKYSFRINVKDPTSGEWKNIERGGFTTIAEAKAARAKLLAEYAEQPMNVVTRKKKVTLEQIYSEFLNKYAIYDREQATLRKYDSIYRNHLNRWGKAKIETVTPETLSEYLFSLTESHSYSYIISIYRFMKILLDFAYDKGHIAKRISSKITTPKPSSNDGQIKIYTQAELDLFEKRFESTHSITAFKIGRATGVRCAECYGLLWDDVDWIGHTISITKQMVWEDGMWCLRNTKTPSSIRKIEIPDSLYNYLKELRETQLAQKEKLGVAYRVNRVAIDMGRHRDKIVREDLELVNIKSNGEMLTPDSEKFLGRISRKELPVAFKYHNLRHTHASWLAEHNVPAIVTQKRLGHSKEETTLRYYSHITQGMKDNLISLLNTAL